MNSRSIVVLFKAYADQYPADSHSWTIFELLFSSQLACWYYSRSWSSYSEQGFILDSLSDFKLSKTQHYWIKSKSITEEIMAVGMLFLIMQSQSLQSLLMSLGVLSLLLLGLPLLFKLHIRFIAPYAPKSELAFLVLMALLSGG